MTDNIYCPLCSQILEADSDSSVHLRKQCKWGSGGWGVGLTWLYVDSVDAGECFKRGPQAHVFERSNGTKHGLLIEELLQGRGCVE